MTADALLAEMHDAGIRLSRNGDRLHVEAKPGTVTPEIRERLAANKPELMAALQPNLLKQQAPAAIPAIAAIPEPMPASESQESQESQGGTPEIRAHLLKLAARHGLPLAMVEHLPADDVAGCHGLTDDTLLAYLRALDQGTVMDRGIAPPDYTQATHCAGCGPVWLWQGAPARLVACPWCFRRKASKAIPRPPVSCADCVHRIPDPVNPEAGMGSCRVSANRWHWPMQSHPCGDHRPTADTAGKPGPKP